MDNITRARLWMEDNWNQRRADVVAELLHPEAVGHMEGGTIRGHDEFLQARAGLLSAFPNLAIEVEACIADGDDVAVRWVLSGRHDADAFGIPASGRTFRARGTTWFRFRDGMIIGGSDTWNQGGVLAALKDGTSYASNGLAP